MKLKHVSLAIAAHRSGRGQLAPLAQKKYDTGATDTEIKIGDTKPYSGPASAYGTIGKAIGAYFNKVNAEGGINGRKVNFITLRRRLQPAEDGRAGAQAGRGGRSAVRLPARCGTPSNTAIHKYMNAKKVPQLFVATGATKWGDPKNYPWTMGWQPNYQTEGQIYAKYMLENQAQREDRRALPERRLRQGLPEGPRRTAWATRPRR